jgi:hypothetical protein
VPDRRKPLNADPLGGEARMAAHRPTKSVWTDADFDAMGWHDATLWSTLADSERFEFLVDLDYIFEWVKPAPEETHYKFSVSPVTMIFENAHTVKYDIESAQGTIEVADLHRENPRPTPNGKLEERTYRFECQEGEISLKATDFQMIVRRSPALLGVHSLNLEQREGVSFDRKPTAQN